MLINTIIIYVALILGKVAKVIIGIIKIIVCLIKNMLGLFLKYVLHISLIFAMKLGWKSCKEDVISFLSFFKASLKKIYKEHKQLIKLNDTGKKKKMTVKLYLFLSKFSYIDLFLLSFRNYYVSTKKICQYKVSGIKKFCIDNKQKYCVIEPEMEREIYKAEFWRRRKGECQKYCSPETYIAELDDIIVIGGSIVLLSNKTFLNDMAFYDDENRINLSYASLRKIVNGYAIIEEGKEDIKEYDMAINLVNVATFNYYHTLIETLPKLLIADNYKEYQGVPLLVDAVIYEIPQMRAVLEIINRYNHPVIIVGANEKVKVSKMIYISPNVWMPINVYKRDMFRMSDFMIGKSYLENMRNLILDSVNINKSVLEGRYFISRKNTKTVRLKNEERVRRLFNDNGFEVVYTEEMSFAEQVTYFANARCIVAATGAALANIIFCKPGTKIVCIMPMEFKFEMYSTIAYLLQLDVVFLDAEIVERTEYISADTYILDEIYAENFIKECC